MTVVTDRFFIEGCVLQTSHIRLEAFVIQCEMHKVSGEILALRCSCTAGEGEKCKHILAVLLFKIKPNEIVLSNII